MKRNLCVSLSLSMLWFGTTPAEPAEMKLGVKIPWNTRVKLGFRKGNTSFTNSHNNTWDYWSEWMGLWEANEQIGLSLWDSVK